ncbi:ABC transporter permease, partial [Staphylococcus sp. EG-SA-29]|nr:ABC transporter permease [Staphylococcus sp. EG-SA-29]
LLGLAGLPLRASAAGRLAAGSARRHPLRASRTSMGLVIGITLIMMFATLGQTFQTVMTRWSRELGIAEDQTSSVMRSIDDVLWFLTAMLVFSLVIAAIGVVNNMQASVMQRTRELGMLRTIGLSTAGLWRMILAETAQLTLAAALFAIPLGILYGWC